MEGTSPAINAVPTSNSPAATNVATSVGSTPYSCADRNRPSHHASGTPSASPTTAIQSASRITSQPTSRPRAPNATRTPISRVRRDTTYDITPYKPTIASDVASTAKATVMTDNSRSCRSDCASCPSSVRGV